eukprot:374529-Amphidinium_carterae.2
MLHGTGLGLGGEACLPESLRQPLCCWLFGFERHADGSHAHLEGADGVGRHVHGLHLLKQFLNSQVFAAQLSNRHLIEGGHKAAVGLAQAGRRRANAKARLCCSRG